MLVVVTILSDFVPHGVYVVVSTSMTLLFPLAMGIAVVRYRLYDIDQIINRTLVYGLLTALLGSMYAGTVLVLGQVFGGWAKIRGAGWWPAPPWPWLRCSSRPGAASK
jgi:hypothetical protein